ncbi:hypothetical protein LTR28_000534, partial [Elasticomyces elasticus]
SQPSVSEAVAMLPMHAIPFIARRQDRAGAGGGGPRRSVGDSERASKLRVDGGARGVVGVEAGSSGIHLACLHVWAFSF